MYGLSYVTQETHIDMKHILTIVAALALTFSANAGCGKKVTTKGTLQSYNAQTKKIVVVAGKKKVTLSVTGKTKGNPAQLKGKSVVVTSEHKKVDEIKAAKG